MCFEWIKNDGKIFLGKVKKHEKNILMGKCLWLLNILIVITINLKVKKNHVNDFMFFSSSPSFHISTLIPIFRHIIAYN